MPKKREKKNSTFCDSGSDIRYIGHAWCGGGGSYLEWAVW
ncbi:hypothetical protein CCICO_10665 [Corynebacterium ciconiae DSM 44920]|nr:hypothetical protein CCICO_10665 [Corynebacterium ciconiae DSM 44920]